MNIVIFISAAAAALLDGKKWRFPAAEFVGLACLVGFGALTVEIGREEYSILWPCLAISCFYFFQEIITALGDKRGSPVLAIYFGLSPLLLAQAQGPFSLVLYLIGLEIFKHFARWNESSATGTGMARIQAMDIFKAATFLLILGLSFVGLESPNYDQLHFAQGTPVLALTIAFAASALLYLGVFESSKDERRVWISMASANPVFSEVIYRAFIPAILIINTKTILSKMSFSEFLAAQTIIIGFFAFALALSAYKALKSSPNCQKYTKFYFFLISGSYLYMDDFTSFKYLACVVAISGIHTLFFWAPESLNWQKLKNLLLILILPTPFSPLLWLLMLENLRYVGPLKAILVGFSALVVFCGFFLFNREKNLLMNRHGEVSIKGINLLSIALLTVFVSVLFVARIML